jgi:ankyrin repeat protein
LLLVLCSVCVLGQDIFAAIGSDDSDTVFKIVNTYSPNMVNKQDPTSRPINRKGPGGQTPLMYSVLTGKVWAVKMLLENGANVDIKEESGYTPMHGAGFQGRPEIAQILIDHGVPTSPRHKDGYVPLHRACWGKEKRHADTVKVFLKNGVDIDILADDGRSCRDMTQNTDTLKVLDEWEKREEL